MDFIYEIIIALFITTYFIKKENPKVHFLFLGYFFFTLSLILQIPFKILELKLGDYLGGSLIPSIIMAPLLISIAEITKYFSMKRYLKTKSKKNGILFGIGWTTLESINYYTIAFFTFVLGALSFQFDYSFFLSPDYSLLNFIFFFIVNVAVTVLVIMSVIRKKKFYLIYSIILSLVVFYGIFFLSGDEKNIFSLAAVLFSLYLIFRYRKF